MKLLFFISMVGLLYGCSSASSKAPPHAGADTIQKTIPKDTLLTCIREAADLLNSGHFKTTDLLHVFNKRADHFKIKADSVPPAAMADSTREELQIIVDPSALHDALNTCAVEIINLPQTVAEKNDFLDLKYIEQKFGSGKLIAWHSDLGLPPPKEYPAPVQFVIPHNASVKRPAYLSVISDRPNDKNYKGILYFKLCY